MNAFDNPRKHIIGWITWTMLGISTTLLGLLSEGAELAALSIVSLWLLITLMAYVISNP